MEFSRADKGMGALALALGVIFGLAAWAKGQIPSQTHAQSAAEVPHPPTLLTQCEPRYPKKAKDAGVVFTEMVQVPIIIRRDGSVRVLMEEFSPSNVPEGTGLRRAAIEAVEKWRYSPGRLGDGTPVKTRSLVEIAFTPDASGQCANVVRE